MENLGGTFGIGGSYPWAEISVSELSEMSHSYLQQQSKVCEEKIRSLRSQDVEDSDKLLSAVSDQALCLHIMMYRSYEKYALVDKELESLRSELSEQEECCSQLREERNESNHVKQELESEVDRLVKEKRELLEQADSYKRLSQENDEIDRLKQQKTVGLMSRIDGLVWESEKKEREFIIQIERKEREIRRLQEQLSKIQDELISTKKENFQLRSEVKDLQQLAKSVPATSVQGEWVEMLKRTEETLRELKRTNPLIGGNVGADREELKSSEISLSGNLNGTKGQEWFRFCKNITPFNSDTTKAGIDTFLAGMKSKMKTRSPPFTNEEKIAIIRLTLEGSAQITLEKYPEDVQKDFSRLCERLQKDFGRFPCAEAALAALRGKEGKQGPQERPGEFVRRLERLCGQAYGKAFHGKDDIQLRIAFTEGLVPHVRDKVESLALTNLDDMVSKAEVFFHKLKSVSISEQVQVFSLTDSQPNQLQLEHGLNVVEQGKASSGSQTLNREGKKTTKNESSGNWKSSHNFKGLCFKCNKPGHMARDCKVKTDGEQSVQQDGFKNFMESMKAFFDQHMNQSPVTANR